MYADGAPPELLDVQSEPGADESSSQLADVAGWSACGIAFIGSIAVAAQSIGFGPIGCTLRARLGIPCLACGLSTAGLRLFHGELWTLAREDFLGMLFLLGIALVALAQIRYVLEERYFGSAKRRFNTQFSGLVLAVLLAAHWIATLSGVVHLAPLRS